MTDISLYDYANCFHIQNDHRYHDMLEKAINKIKSILKDLYTKNYWNKYKNMYCTKLIILYQRVFNIKDLIYLL